MSSSSDGPSLDAALKPLRFAAKNDFRNLMVVRGLEPAITAAIDGIKGADAATKKRLSQAKKTVKGIDDLGPRDRRARVEALLEILGEAVATPPAKPKKTRTRAKQGEMFDAPSASTTARRIRKAAPKADVADAKKRVSMAKATPGHRLADVVGVGPKTAERLAKNGIETVQDMLFLLPIRYEDRSRFVPIDELEAGETASVRGHVAAAQIRFMGRKKRMFEIAVRDDTGGAVSCRFFRFSKNQMEAKYARGVEVVVSGKVTKWGAMFQMVHPEIRLCTDEEPAPEGVLPVYPEFQAVPKKTLRKIAGGLAAACAHQIEEPLPESLLGRLGLPPLADAVRRAHLPEAAKGGALEHMRSRLVFDELFFLQLALARLRRSRDEAPGLAHEPDVEWRVLAEKILPFEPTGAQARALDTITKDLSSPKPMNRLLMGDVGAGKTAVAFLAAAVVKAAGRQTALLAPTEILAEQHFRNALKLLEPHGFDVRLLTGSTKAAARREILVGLASKTVDLLVGTHALLEPPVRFADLGLAIVDEQHRFGVEQRGALRAKRDDATPDVLVMTATPIPRTLSLTAYGDLRTSILDELPPGRSPTETTVIAMKDKDKGYAIVQQALEEGRQAFVVFPLVEVSEKLDLTAATEEVAELQKRFAPKEVALLHGRMKPEEKSAVMARFVAGEVAVLASTTVVEVGVDVENASVMVVEHAERFGLSQLHQLRGRVGRGRWRGQCVLLAESFDRVQVLAETNSGFEVAERDLELRGPGEVLGTRQSGLTDLQLADLVHDQAVLERAREEAFAILERDPDLAEADHAGLAAELERRFANKIELAKVG